MHLDRIEFLPYNRQAIGVWRSLVSRLVRVQEAAGSNPATPTMRSVPIESAYSTYGHSVSYYITCLLTECLPHQMAPDSRGCRLSQAVSMELSHILRLVHLFVLTRRRSLFRGPTLCYAILGSGKSTFPAGAGISHISHIGDRGLLLILTRLQHITFCRNRSTRKTPYRPEQDTSPQEGIVTSIFYK